MIRHRAVGAIARARRWLITALDALPAEDLEPALQATRAQALAPLTQRLSSGHGRDDRGGARGDADRSTGASEGAEPGDVG